MAVLLFEPKALEARFQKKRSLEPRFLNTVHFPLTSFHAPLSCSAVLQLHVFLFFEHTDLVPTLKDFHLLFLSLEYSSP